MKVIFENCYLDDAQKIKLCEICTDLNADWVKTSTGYGTGGATHEDLKLMRQHAGDQVQVKAAGGVRDFESLLAVRSIGVTRCGASRTADILGEARKQLTDWISKVEYGVFGLPKADLVIHLDLPAETAQELIARKSKRDYTDKAADLQEADCDYLTAVRQAYLDLAMSEPDWQTIPLVDNTRLRTIEEIATDIFDRVHSLLDTP